MEAAPSNVPVKAETANGPERSSRKSGKEEKSRRKDDKNVEQVMKALNVLETTEEKLAAMCKKYTEVVDENRKLQLTVKQWEKSMNTLQREKEQLQGDHSKAVLTRSRLESLCRELQRQNKQVKDESMVKIREEEEKRKEVSAKFNTTLAEITTLMSSSNEKTNKLRDENVEITKKFKSICDQSSIQQQQVDKMNTQRKLESELTEARLTKQRLEFTAEKEILLKEKQQLFVDIHTLRSRVTELEASELNLKAQVTLYADRYDEFQTALTKSNEVFGGFKGEMEKMSKKITRLEKETTTWKSRWEKSHQALLEMAADKTQSDGELALANRRHTQLEKLCRTLQNERVKLLAQIKSLNQTPSSDDKSIDMATADVEIAMASAAFDSAKLKSDIGNDVQKALSSFTSPEVEAVDDDDITVASEMPSSVSDSPVLEDVVNKMSINSTSGVEQSPVPCSEILPMQTAVDAVDLDKSSATNVDGVSSLSNSAFKMGASYANVATQNKGDKKGHRKDAQSPTEKSKPFSANQTRKDKTELKSSPKEKKDKDKGKPMTVSKVKVDSSQKKDKKGIVESPEEKEVNGSLKEKSLVDLSNVMEKEIVEVSAVSLSVEKGEDTKPQEMNEMEFPSKVSDSVAAAQIEVCPANVVSVLNVGGQNTAVTQTELKNTNLSFSGTSTMEKTDVKLPCVTEVKVPEVGKDAVAEAASILPSQVADVHVKDSLFGTKDTKSIIEVQENVNKSKLLVGGSNTTGNLNVESKENQKETVVTLSEDKILIDTANKEKKDIQKQNLSLSELKMVSSIDKELHKNENQTKVELKVTDENEGSLSIEEKINFVEPEDSSSSAWLEVERKGNRRSASPRKNAAKIETKEKVESPVTEKKVEMEDASVQENKDKSSARLDIDKKGNRRSVSPRKNAKKTEEKNTDVIKEIETSAANKTEDKDKAEILPASDVEKVIKPLVDNKQDAPTNGNATTQLEVEKTGNKRSPSPRKKNANKTEVKSTESVGSAIKTEVGKSVEDKKGSTGERLEVEKSGSTRAGSPRKNANKVEEKDKVVAPVVDTNVEVKPLVEEKKENPTTLGVEKSGSRRSASPRKCANKIVEKDKAALVADKKTVVDQPGEIVEAKLVPPESETKVCTEISKGSIEASSINLVTTSNSGVKDDLEVKNINADLSAKGMDDSGLTKKSTDASNVDKSPIADVSAISIQPSLSGSSNKDVDKKDDTSNSQDLVDNTVLSTVSETANTIDVDAKPSLKASIEVNKHEDKERVNVKHSIIETSKDTNVKGNNVKLQSSSEAKVPVKPDPKKAKAAASVNKVPTSPRKEVNKKEKTNKEELNKSKKSATNKSNVETNIEVKSQDSGESQVSVSGPGVDVKVESVGLSSIPSGTDTESKREDKIEVEFDISKTVLDALNEEKKDESKLLGTSESVALVNIQESEKKMDSEPPKSRIPPNLASKAVTNKKKDDSIKSGKKDSPKLVTGTPSKLKDVKSPSLSKSKVPAKVPDGENAVKTEGSIKKTQLAQRADPKKRDMSSEKSKKTDNVSVKSIDVETKAASVTDSKVDTKVTEPLPKSKLQEQGKKGTPKKTKADLNLDADPSTFPSLLDLTVKTPTKLSEGAPSGEATEPQESQTVASEDQLNKQVVEDADMTEVVSKKRKK